jgi:hypothetical protein
MLTDLPPAILNWTDYSKTFDPTARRRRTFWPPGYGPDIVLPRSPRLHVALAVG